MSDVFITSMSAPTISYFSPTTGPVGQWVYIFGSGFVQDQTTVFFDSVEATDVTVYNDTQLGFTLPSSNVTSGLFKVINVDGEVSSSDQFTVGVPSAPPIVSGFKAHSDSSINWTYVYGDYFVFGQTTVSYNNTDQKDAMVYSPNCLGFEKNDVADEITTLTVVTPNGTVSYP